MIAKVLPSISESIKLLYQVLKVALIAGGPTGVWLRLRSGYNELVGTVVLYRQTTYPGRRSRERLKSP